MKVAIMQPYFLPYIGYFQLISSVDTFIVYDNIKYTKKGWINRNRCLVHGADYLFTLPLMKASDHLNIYDRIIDSQFDRDKLLRRFIESYSKAPQFSIFLPILKEIIYYEELNLFKFLFNSILIICHYLDIKTKIKISSNIDCDHFLKKEHRVVAICKACNADTYINPIGGTELYQKEYFLDQNLKLEFINPILFVYPQFNHQFVPWLSIIDVLMFNDVEKIQRDILTSYEII